MRTHPAAAFRTFALSAVTVVTLAACTQGSSTGPSPSTSAAAPTTPATQVTTVDDKGGVGAIKDLTGLRCEEKDGVWSFTGTVHNTTKKAQKYTVEASVVNPQGWGVVDATTVRVSVDAGEKKDVAARGFHTEKPDAASRHRCVTRVVRHAVG